MVRADAGGSDSMRTLFALTAVLALTVTASAQSEAVTVNNGAVAGNGQMLMDPGTGQLRFVPALLQPWQNGPIRLHPPRHHHTKAVADSPTYKAGTYNTGASETPAIAAAPQAEAPVRQHRKKAPVVADTATAPAAEAAPRQQRRAAPPPASAPIGGFSDYTDLISPQQAQPATPPKKTAAIAPPVRKAEPPPVPKVVPPAPKVEKPVQKASLEPSRPPKPRAPAGNRKDSIAFAPNASDPSTTAVSAVRALAATLASSLGEGGARIQLMAYAGMRGEKSSDTRRLSLKRALVVRQLLIDDGVPAERIDVFALGGSDDDGPLDRVDVFVKG
jgi:outer membrane protein OmpA-like peptidoglycan-associated protein